MFDQRQFRDCLSQYPTGVAIISTWRDGQALGVTVNSFASVSLEPPLILWSVEHGRDRHALFVQAERFAVNVLAADQKHLAEACARDAALDQIGGTWSGEHAPRLEGAVAVMDCRRHAIHPGGDHDIILGEVVSLHTRSEAPALVFHRGGYGEAGQFA